MEILGSAASVIAVIQLTGSLVRVCGGYIQKVKHARANIITLRQAAEGLQPILQDLHKLLHNSSEKRLPTSTRLVSDITRCLSDLQVFLQALNQRLESGIGKISMRKFGLRAWKWPLDRAEVDEEVQKLKRYQDLIFSALAVDRTSLMVGAAQKSDRIDQNIEFGKLESVAGASFDSFSNRDEVQCLPGTRVEILRQIMDWALSPGQKNIFWLNGMAGTGKSTISRTVAVSLKDTDHLGASFFFKRGEEDRGNAKKFFPTLINQLIHRLPGLRSCVQKTLREYPGITSKSLVEQFDKLILQPLHDLNHLGQQRQTAVIVIVIDALDECDHDNDLRVIIRLLSRLKEAEVVFIRIFLTSRPELPLRLGFSEIANHDLQDLVLHEIPEEVTQSDIVLFLKDRFATIRHNRKISEGWPADNVIQELTAMSVPLFISAATICRYIEHSKWEPTRRLVELLQDQARYTDKMDKTYLPILERQLDDQDSDELEQKQLLQEFQDIVGIIILLAVPLSVRTLSQFLGIEIDRISNRLDSFQSVLSVPTNRDLPVRTLHLSFRDFLVRSKGRFGVNEPYKHGDIALHCLGTMRRHLQRNICKLESPSTYRADIDAQSLRQCLPQELEYSCRYWIYHLEHSNIPHSWIENVFLFLKEHFLHWVEAMSLLGLVSEVVGMIILLQKVTTEHHTEMFDFLQDARHYILKNRQIADVAPLQLYYSGLIFAPRTTMIQQVFKTELPSWLRQLPSVDEIWSAGLQALEGHLDWVQSVAISPDGRLLASGSGDKTVRLWGITTGALQQTLEGHLGSVHTVAFSPNSQLLASGLDDNTVRLWDLATGVLQQTLEGHSRWVRSVAFSPDGRLLASSSDDHTVRLWDLATGALQKIIDGHLDRVWSVTFSPDSRLLASGSDDYIIRLWNSTTGAIHQTLEGHSGQVQSVAFTPNGKLLASGSADKTICLWDLATGTLQQVLEGHTHWVRSVAFSSDGKLIASGSHDRTVRLWNTTTGALQQTLEGHLQPVSSVAFSTDSRLLISGSCDQTVRLWDVMIGAVQQVPDGHLGDVTSMAFSPDGQLLASGSTDKSVRVWDTTTGTLQQTLKGHIAEIQSVAFSPDSRLVASGSRDTIVCLWDLTTGALQHTLEGHLETIFSVAFSPDGQLLASGSADKSVRLWDTTTGTLQQALKAHLKYVYSVAFSPDGRLLASSSADDIWHLLDTTVRAPQQTLEGLSGWVQSVAFPPNGRLEPQHPDGSNVRLWDTKTGALQRAFNVKRASTDFEISQNESYLGTDLGSFDVQFGRGNYAANTNNVNIEFLERSRWIKLNDEKVLWLPPECRPRCSAMHGSLLALSHSSGRVFFIGFRV